MKLTPRRAENAVAELLSGYFVQWSLDPVERVPVIGRKGPDLSINQAKIVVDVKSRKEVPNTILAARGCVLEFIGRPTLLGVRICELELLFDDQVEHRLYAPLKTIQGYFDHMDEWRRERLPEGVTALALRKPGMPYGDTLFVISKSQLEVFRDNTQHRNHGNPAQRQ